LPSPLPAVRKVLVGWLGLPMFLRMLAPIAVMASLWVSSSIPPTPRPPSVWRDLLHNGAHIVAYAVLAGCWLLAQRAASLLTPAPGAWSVALRSVLLAIAYGVVDEWHQSFVGRVCSVGDVLSDASGAALAVAALLAVLRADLPARHLLPWCAIACAASVAIATWLPW